jgi:hypothetical protein
MSHQLPVPMSAPICGVGMFTPERKLISSSHLIIPRTRTRTQSRGLRYGGHTHPVSPAERHILSPANDPFTEQANSFYTILDSWEPFIAPIVLTAFAVFTRMYRIGRSNIVTWDEAQYVT